MEILHATLAELEQLGVVEERRIVSLFLSSYFTVVQLEGGDTGASMSYYGDCGAVVDKQLQELLRAPFLLDWCLDKALCKERPIQS